MAISIRTATDDDAEWMAGIYNWYVLNTIVSFETDPVSTDGMRTRIREKLVRHDWLVGEQDGARIGYACYGSFRPRAAYNHTAESTVYVAREHQGRGHGTTLYTALLDSARRRGMRELIGVIALPNPESIRLHERLGFREVGILRQAGHKLGRYIDVGLWQRAVNEGRGMRDEAVAEAEARGHDEP